MSYHAHFALDEIKSTLESTLSAGSNEPATSTTTTSSAKPTLNPADIRGNQLDANAIPFSRPGTPKIGHDQLAFVGLGNMGSLMALNLAKMLTTEEMPPLVVWNRSSARVDKFKELADKEGVKYVVGGDLEEIGENCDIIITSLGSDAACEEVYNKLFAGQERKKVKGTGVVPDLDHGKSTIFVDTSTVYPHTSGKIERQSSSSPYRQFITCPVFGPPPLAKNAQLILAMSGSYWAKKHVGHLLVPSIGRRVLDLGSNVEKAMSFKLVGNSFILGLMELIAETTTLADQSGVGAENLYTLFETFFPAPSILGYGRKMIDNNFKGDGGFTLQGGIKDASHIRRLADECSVPMPIIDIAHQHLITARANGGDHLDWSSMVAGQRMSAGLPPFEKKSHLQRYDE